MALVAVSSSPVRSSPMAAPPPLRPVLRPVSPPRCMPVRRRGNVPRPRGDRLRVLTVSAFGGPRVAAAGASEEELVARAEAAVIALAAAGRSVALDTPSRAARRRVVHALRDRLCVAGLRVACTAYTGAGAAELCAGASTLHAFAGLRPDDDDNDAAADDGGDDDGSRADAGTEAAAARWRRVDVLLLDEADRVPAALLGRVAAGARRARAGCRGADGHPLGGVRLVLLGDMTQCRAAGELTRAGLGFGTAFRTPATAQRALVPYKGTPDRLGLGPHCADDDHGTDMSMVKHHRDRDRDRDRYTGDDYDCPREYDDQDADPGDGLAGDGYDADPRPHDVDPGDVDADDHGYDDHGDYGVDEGAACEDAGGEEDDTAAAEEEDDTAAAAAEAAPAFAFESDAWRLCVTHVVCLPDVHVRDASLARLLCEMRRGALTAASVGALGARGGPPAGAEVVPRAVAVRFAQDQRNRAEADALPGERRPFRCTVERDDALSAEQAGHAARWLLRVASPPATLTLARGDWVALTETVCASAGLVRGACGVVEDFVHAPADASRHGLPTVRFVPREPGSPGRLLEMRRHAWRLPLSARGGGGTSTATHTVTLRQLPLRPAYAVWARAVAERGWLLPAVQVALSADRGGAAVCGADAYAALCACPSLGAVHVTLAEPEALRLDPRVTAFYARLAAAPEPDPDECVAAPCAPPRRKRRAPASPPPPRSDRRQRR